MKKADEDELIKLLRDKTAMARFGIDEVRGVLAAMKANGWVVKRG